MDFFSELVKILGTKLGLIPPPDWCVNVDTEFSDPFSEIIYWKAKVYVPKGHLTSEGSWMYVTNSLNLLVVKGSVDSYEWGLTSREEESTSFSTGMFAYEAAFRAIDFVDKLRDRNKIIERLENCLNKS